jgi:hypothetical protein
MGGPVAPASAQQASAVSAAKKLTIDGPSTGRVGSPVKVRMYVPSESGTIDWGDGTTTPVKSGISLSLCMGSASACADARRTLTSRHAYAAPGRYTITVVSPDSTPKRASLTIRIR